jgi:hypothetical protein
VGIQQAGKAKKLKSQNLTADGFVNIVWEQPKHSWAPEEMDLGSIRTLARRGAFYLLLFSGRLSRTPDSRAQIPLLLHFSPLLHPAARFSRRQRRLLAQVPLLSRFLPCAGFVCVIAAPFCCVGFSASHCSLEGDIRLPHWVVYSSRWGWGFRSGGTAMSKVE